VEEVCARVATGAQLGELEEVGLDAFEPIVAEFREPGHDAVDAGACEGGADEGFRKLHQAAKSAVAMTAAGVPA
jgi:hypothetical protein